MLTLGGLQFIVFLMAACGFTMSGVLLAMDKFYLFNRMGIKHPCFYCITFWVSLVVSAFLMWDSMTWMSIVVAFGSASIGRSLTSF